MSILNNIDNGKLLGISMSNNMQHYNHLITYLNSQKHLPNNLCDFYFRITMQCHKSAIYVGISSNIPSRNSILI